MAPSKGHFPRKPEGATVEAAAVLSSLASSSGNDNTTEVGAASPKQRHLPWPSSSDNSSRQPLDPDILARMVTASDAGLRVATMQAFRRSLTNCAPDYSNNITSQPAANTRGKIDAADVPSATTVAMGVSPLDNMQALRRSLTNCAPDYSNNITIQSAAKTRGKISAADVPSATTVAMGVNPLLKMMEERMTARQQQGTGQVAALVESRVGRDARIAPPSMSSNKSSDGASSSKVSNVLSPKVKSTELQAHVFPTATGNKEEASGQPLTKMFINSDQPEIEKEGIPQQRKSTGCQNIWGGIRHCKSISSLQQLQHHQEQPVNYMQENFRQTASRSPAQSLHVHPSALNNPSLLELQQRTTWQQSQQQQPAAAPLYHTAEGEPAGVLIHHNSINVLQKQGVQLTRSRLGLNRGAMSYTGEDNIRRQRQISAHQLTPRQRVNEQFQFARRVSTKSNENLFGGGQQLQEPSTQHLTSTATGRVLPFNPSLDQTVRRIPSFCKRRLNCDLSLDEEDVSRASFSTQNTYSSQNSSTATSNKVQRSHSHRSIRSNLSLGSMNRQYISSQNQNNSFLENINSMQQLRNQSFTQIFGNANSVNRQQRGHGSTSSLLSRHHEAGMVPAITIEETGGRPQQNSVFDLQQQQQQKGPVEQDDLSLPQVAMTIQNHADEYMVSSPFPPSSPAPPSSHTASTEANTLNSGEACRSTVIISDIPNGIKYKNVPAEDTMKPIDVVKEALASRGEATKIMPSLDMEDTYFDEVTVMYDHEVVDAIRSNDVARLRKLHESGTKFNCGNKFGETLMHLACRRSQKEVISMLLDEGRASLRVRDDFGRLPFHDACWRAEPNLDILDMLLDRAPETLLLSDKRGHTPLDYSQKQHWSILVPFLKERKDKFRPVVT